MNSVLPDVIKKLFSIFRRFFLFELNNLLYLSVLNYITRNLLQVSLRYFNKIHNITLKNMSSLITSSSQYKNT